MIRTLAVLVISTMLLMANSFETKVEIYQQIADALTFKPGIVVYVTDEEFVQIVKKAPRMRLSKTCERIDLIFCHDEKELPKACRSRKVPIFLDSYDALRTSENAVGAFFWQKGRPTLIFLEQQLERLEIKLSKGFSRYVEKKLW